MEVGNKNQEGKELFREIEHYITESLIQSVFILSKVLW